MGSPGVGCRPPSGRMVGEDGVAALTPLPRPSEPCSKVAALGFVGLGARLRLFEENARKWHHSLKTKPMR